MTLYVSKPSEVSGKWSLLKQYLDHWFRKGYRGKFFVVLCCVCVCFNDDGGSEEGLKKKKKQNWLVENPGIFYSTVLETQKRESAWNKMLGKQINKQTCLQSDLVLKKD